MNELLQKHGCSNVFSIPEGLRELMADISREVLREQPRKIFDFIANYLSVLLVTREHGILAVKILEDLCDCKPSVSEHLIQLGMVKTEAEMLAQVIKEEIESVIAVEGREKIREEEILKKVLKRSALDEELTAQVCEVTRNAYRDYWYRKKLLEQNLKVQPDQPWEIAAQHTLEIYKRTKPSYSELTRATQRIQAAYKGYYVRKKMLKHLQPKKKHAPKSEVPGPPTDIAEAREMDLGRVVDVKVKQDDVDKMFADEEKKALNLGYDPNKVIMYHEEGEGDPLEMATVERKTSRMMSSKSMSAHLFSSHDVKDKDSQHAASPSPQPTEELPPSKDEQTTRISFGVPQYKEINDELKAVASIAQAGAETPKEEAVAEVAEAIEVPPEVPAVPEVAEVAAEVPEDITVDDDSAPAASVPSSAPDTARSTDVEDTTAPDTADTGGETGTGGASTEEEGE
ncbi:uncharacterized protein LOC126370785 [Pectinophora gossypiella]|uniref:uncharacterized protein LOC126370785 n=1 Tax=Pectinophora gossypiella TaxID=13191 RepID=UPI00214DFF7F|nr:uncharacterized protein LOC126370785 [Pectinophora gossypiella]